ncbi:BrnT family toxin [Sulfitobacter aestuariivivens]|uniref:BrnT family toxin n=1 Tax=Sulfitobacter aestuariivivens TaxID=2766981 RepID=A0A927HI48_9RHOB|nr:BrnT family toxin [Sulfitobacter aestuariivivens]
MAISRTATGRPVFIAFCWRGQKLRPISARYMHAKESARYDQTFPQGSSHDH